MGGVIVKEYMEKRVLKSAHYIIETNNTIRETASKFGYSKATVHKDLKERLPELDENLSEEVKEVMRQHIADRHIHGGNSTKQKYQNLDIASKK